MRRRHWVVLALVAGIVSGSVATAGVAATSGKKQVRAQQTFTLPVIATLSGAGVANTVGDVTMFKMAAEAINAAGGVDGSKLVLKVYDDQSSPTTAAELMRSVGPSALIVDGSDLTSASASAFPVAKSLQVPLVGLSSDVGVLASGQPWAFSTFAPAQAFIPPLVQQWATLVHVHSASVIYDAQNAATLAQGQTFLQALSQRGVSTSEVKTQTGLPSYQAQAASIASQKPGGVAVCGLVADAVAIVHALRSEGFNGPLLMCPASTGNTMLSLLGDVSGVYLATSWWPGIGGPKAVAFTKAFEARSGGQMPGSAAAPAYYYEITVIANAINATHALTSKGSLQQRRNALRDYLAKLKNFEGLTGTFSMSSDGYLLGPAELLSINGGQVVAVNATRPPATLRATVSATKIALSGATKLVAGPATLTVRDNSAKQNFRLTGPGVKKATGLKFRGKVVWKLRLRAGTYKYSSAGSKRIHGKFVVKK